MAGEEDVELRDLVAQTLEAKGVLGKIRAQLRASVFLALEEQESQQKPHPLASSKLLQYLKTKEGQTVTALVREFLEFFELDYTCSVFDPESNALETYPGREKLAKELNLDTQAVSSGPLLAAVLHKSTSQSPIATPVTRQLNFQDHAVSQLVSNESSRIVTSGTATSAIATSLPTDGTLTQSSTVTGLGGVPNVITYEHEPGFQTFKLSPHTTQPNDILHIGGVGSTIIAASTSTNTHTTTSSIGLNTNENSNLTSGLEPRITSALGASTTTTTTASNGQPPPPLAQKSLAIDSQHPGISISSLEEQGMRAELGESFVDSSLDVDKLLDKTGAGASNFNDIFALPLSSVPGDRGTAGVTSKVPLSLETPGKGAKGDDSYEDDFHSDGQISEHLDDPSNSLLSSRASDKFETEDHTLSETSAAGGFDHTEHVHS